MYRYWFYFSSLLVVVVAQEDQLFVFSENKAELLNCIENYLISEPYYLKVDIAAFLADRISRRYCGKTKNRLDLFQSVSNFCHELKTKQLSFILPVNKTHNPLLQAIKSALIHCAVSNQLNHSAQLLPTFINEPYEISVLLDYILVDWPKKLHYMIATRNGRAILRRYAEDSIARLACALHSINGHEKFRFLLRFYWMLRAQKFFSGQNSKPPYLRHYFTLKNPFPHTYDNQFELSLRNFYPFLERNPQISQEDFDRIMRIHSSDRLDLGGTDIFSVYEQIGTMSTAQYYIETHIDQFYRILFFFMELQIRGITTDEKDTYSKRLSYNLIPSELQEIVHNDEIYRNYLLSLRKKLEKLMINNPVYQIDISQIISSAQVREEDLITLLSICIQHNIIDGISTTTSSPINGTTPIYQQSKRKGSSWSNSNGKHFCRRPSTSSLRDQVKYNNSRERLPSNNFNYPSIPTDESSFFTRTFIGTMTNFCFETNIHHKEL